jgi:hypothetical protein
VEDYGGASRPSLLLIALSPSSLEHAPTILFAGIHPLTISQPNVEKAQDEKIEAFFFSLDNFPSRGTIRLNTS